MRQRGFTLVEVVVAMAVLSLVVLTLGASLRSLGQTAQRVDERVELIDEMRVTTSMLRDIFSRVSLQRSKDNSGLQFDAQPQAMSWIGVMPARFGAAGRFYFHLATEKADDGSAILVLRYAPWLGDGQFPDWSRTEYRVLVRHVSQFQLSYGGDGMAAGWSPGWGNKMRMPPRVRMQLTTDSSEWPPVVMPLRLLSPGGGDGGFVIGGTK